MVFIAMRDITRLDPKLLLAFNALLEERSVTRAALRLNITQQGLSGVLQRMRGLFDDPLFVREGRGITPTPRAQALAPRIKSALASLQLVLESDEFDSAQAEGTIYVSSADYALSIIVAPLFSKFRSLAPNVRLAVRPLTALTFIEEPRGGNVDFAVTVTQLPPPTWLTRRLFEENFLCAVGANHPLAGTEVGIEEFCRYEHLLVSPYKNDFAGVVDRKLAHLGRKRRVGLVIPSFSVAASILEQTDLVAVLPSRILKKTRGSLYIFSPPLELPSAAVLAVWPPRVDQDPLNAWFRQILIEHSETLEFGLPRQVV